MIENKTEPIVEVETPAKTEPTTNPVVATEVPRLYKSFKTEEDWNKYLDGALTQRMEKGVLDKLGAESVEEIKTKYSTAIKEKADLINKNLELEGKLATIETNTIFSKYNVPETNRNDVLTLAKQKVTADVNLDTAVKSVIETYPSFINAKLNFGTGKADPKIVSKEAAKADENRLRRAAGLKPKL